MQSKLSFKPTITIGIPAHNEAKTIGRLLRSISSQVVSTGVIERITIACDGCTDQTAQIAMTFAASDKRITIIDDGKRLGQAGRLNQMYRDCTSDIFITFDADITIDTTHLVQKLVEPFVDQAIGLVGGNNLPAVGKNFIQRAIVRYELAWRSIHGQINGGHTVHNMPGCINAARRDVVRQSQMPESIVANDHYLYFHAKAMGYKFYFAKEAIVHFTVPATLNDFFNQTTRFLSTQEIISNEFRDHSDEEYEVSRALKLRVYREYLVRWPLEMAVALLLQLAARMVLPLRVRDNKTPFWQVVGSSKN